jgi:2-hydroxychromene-2-carboxylate isomerase
VAWAHAGLRAYFTRGVDLSEPAQLRSLLVESSVDVAAAEAAYNNPLWKERLKRENDLAIANGVFGAPFFIVDGEPFWGNDRRVQLEAWIAGQADYSHTVM